MGSHCSICRWTVLVAGGGTALISGSETSWTQFTKRNPGQCRSASFSTMAHFYKAMENAKQHKNRMMPCLPQDLSGFGRPRGTIQRGLVRSISTGSKHSHGPLYRSHLLMIALHTFFLPKILLRAQMDSRLLCGACSRITRQQYCWMTLIA